MKSSAQKNHRSKKKICKIQCWIANKVIWRPSWGLFWHQVDQFDTLLEYLYLINTSLCDKFLVQFARVRHHVTPNFFENFSPKHFICSNGQIPFLNSYCIRKVNKLRKIKKGQKNCSATTQDYENLSKIPPLAFFELKNMIQRRTLKFRFWSKNDFQLKLEFWSKNNF